MQAQDRETLIAVDILTERKRAYQTVFGNPEDVAVAAVMRDLKKFCRHRDTCFHPDPRIHAVAEGRREVLLRIFDFLELPVVPDLVDKYHKQGKKNA